MVIPPVVIKHGGINIPACYTIKADITMGRGIAVWHSQLKAVNPNSYLKSMVGKVIHSARGCT